MVASLMSNYDRPVGVLAAGQYFITQGVKLGEDGLILVSDYVVNTERLVILNFQIPHGPFLSIRAGLKAQPVQKGSQLQIHFDFKDLSFAHRRSLRNFLSS